MRRTVIALLVLVTLLVIASGGPAQATKFSVKPEVVPWGGAVKIVFQNRLNTTIYLPPRPMWSIYDSSNQLVYLEPGYPISMPVRPNQTIQWPWTQRDSSEKQVPVGKYEARCYYTTGPGSPYLKAAFLIADSVVTVGGLPRPGGTVTLDLDSRKSASRTYRVGLSFGKSPGIQLPMGRTLPLNPDNLFFLSQFVGAPICRNFGGTLDGDGKAQASIQIPNLAALHGIRIYSAFVTLAQNAPDGVRDASPAAMIQIR